MLLEEFHAIGRAIAAGTGAKWDEGRSRKAFKKLDADGNGVLGEVEFLSFFEAMVGDGTVDDVAKGLRLVVIEGRTRAQERLDMLQGQLDVGQEDIPEEQPIEGAEKKWVEWEESTTEANVNSKLTLYELRRRV